MWVPQLTQQTKQWLTRFRFRLLRLPCWSKRGRSRKNCTTGAMTTHKKEDNKSGAAGAAGVAHNTIFSAAFDQDFKFFERLKKESLRKKTLRENGKKGVPIKKRYRDSANSAVFFWTPYCTTPVQLILTYRCR